MPCPCGQDDHPELQGVEYALSIPRPCWLLANDPAYRALWNGQETAPTPQPKPVSRRRGLVNDIRVPCRHLGRMTGERGDHCGCGGGKNIPILSCAKHGRCTTEKQLVYRENGRTVQMPWCRVCPAYQPKES